jgi:hypothetical protein
VSISLSFVVMVEAGARKFNEDKSGRLLDLLDIYVHGCDVQRRLTTDQTRYQFS